jgi:AcrR family transcriptional regulator
MSGLDAEETNRSQKIGVYYKTARSQDWPTGRIINMRPRRHTRSGALGEKGRQTRRDIVRKAAPLFNQKGFAGTSMSDLMAATGLLKGGLYRHFESKEFLAQEAFDYAWEKAVNGRLDGLDEVPDAVGRLKGMIAYLINKREGLVAGRYPLMNAAIEADDGNTSCVLVPAKR